MKTVQLQKVLVIDDEQVVLDSVRRVLESEGIAVDATLSSRQGLAWALERRYDLVLTDVRMPEIGGMRVLRDVKRARPALPVVILTGYATVASAVQAMKLGAADYLEKPFAPDALVSTLRRAAASADQRRPEPQDLVHGDEVRRVLARAAADAAFSANLLELAADALEGFDLTPAEKLAILTGDVRWLEDHLGRLAPEVRGWLEARLGAEIW
jgi:DNA-binding NtrC family response regulator